MNGGRPPLPRSSYSVSRGFAACLPPVLPASEKAGVWLVVLALNSCEALIPAGRRSDEAKLESPCSGLNIACSRD